MKKLILTLAIIAMSGCWGYSSLNNEMIGQVKKVNENTPIFCPDFYDADISLGVLRNGVGSMSAQDVWLYVPSETDYKTLKEANESGALVKIKYKNKRWTWCVENIIVTGVEVIK